MKELKCQRCGHTWVSIKQGEKPKVCPRCKSYDYDKPFKRKPKA